MNEGVQILLERMKTHPEEFVAEAQYGISKWGQAIQHLQEYLSKEDKEALDTAWKQTISDEMQRRFTQAVMEELVDPKVEKEQWGDSVLDAAGLTKQHIAQHKIFLAQQQAQAAQQAPGSITNIVGGAGQGLLGTWFGGNK
jgi:C-terminal processing protease CtpA/Prc